MFEQRETYKERKYYPNKIVQSFMRNIKISLIFLISLLFAKLSAQDIHFSQFWLAPIQINPANVGFFEGQTRIAAQHRTQWRAVTKPFVTYASSVDLPLIKRTYRQEIFGIGASVFHDHSGDSRYGTTQLNLSMSYIKGLNRKNNNFLSVGLQVGGAQRTINYSELYFDEQFHNGRFNEDMAHSEQFAKDNFIFGDIGLGVNWIYQPRNRQVWNLGLALFHLNKPKQSLLNDNSIRLDMKMIFTASTSLALDKNIDLHPMIMASFQGVYREIIIGGMTKYILDKNPLSYTTLNMGVFYRAADAAYFMIGGEYMNFNFGLSYDVNMSRLKVASRYKGGWELSVNYIFNRYKPRRIKEVPCPIF